MKDEKIVEMFWERDENAIRETEKKYGELCRYVISGILAIKEDQEECASDVMLALWNSIPPENPCSLKGYLAALCRNLSIT